jgi:hypothetical protein
MHAWHTVSIFSNEGTPMYKVFAFILMCFVAPTTCLAQVKVPIEVVHRGNDRVGQLFVAELKELIRSYRTSPITDRQRPRIVISVATADGDGQLRGNASAISVSILYDAPRMPAEGAFLRALVQSCSRDNAVACARTAAAHIDQEVGLLRKNWPALWASL